MDEFMAWFTQWREGMARWVMQVMHDLPAFLGDVFNTVVQNPIPIAIGLAIAIGTIVLAVVIGPRIVRRVGRNAPAEDDVEVDEEEIDQQTVDDRPYGNWQ